MPRKRPAPRTQCDLRHEEAARVTGSMRIAGVDEVGRGPLFGPVVAAAVILPPGAQFPGLTDSKKLSEKFRLQLDVEIRAHAITFAICEVDAETIDRINIRQATLLAMRTAVSQLALQPDHILVDGRDIIPGLTCRQQAIIQGDSASLSIAAASVLAKVHRDRLLDHYDSEYPGYGLARHKGYPSPEHRAALTRLGPTPLHRRSYAPVQSLLPFL